MTVLGLLPFVAGGFSLLLAGVSLFRRRPSMATWCFSAGMVALGIDSLLTGLALRATRVEDLSVWLTAAFIVKAVVPTIWLCFSMTYSRTDYREVLNRWKVPLAVTGLAPFALSLLFQGELFRVVPADASDELWRLQLGTMAQGLNVIILTALVLTVMNLEQTFRSAVGTMRWRIKFVVLAVVVICGGRLYVRSQAILFSAPDLALWGVESGALLIGCVFLALAYVRSGWAEIAVHPSSAVLRSSLTVIIVGAYLFVVGVLAQAVKLFGGAELFQLQAFVVLVGMAGLAVLLLSDRARQRLHVFAVRHFSKAQHDSVRIWTLFSRRLASVTDQAGLCAVSAKVIAETFDVLSVTLWLLDEEKGQLVLGASTARQGPDGTAAQPATMEAAALIAGLSGRSAPFDLEDVTEPWSAELRRLNARTFTSGGSRLCVHLRAGEQSLGLIVLADRINGAVYTGEELELLTCIGDQIASVLVNLRLAGEVARARELEAFRTMSAFFVHDLKNAAASLNLMLKNLPVHFDNPAFRTDALQGIGSVARRIDDLIARLSALRHRPESVRVSADLNQLVAEALDRVCDVPNIDVTREFQPLPAILADREQIHSVVMNLVMNARDAVGDGGRIQVRTEQRDGRAVLSVTDSGCGMNPAFVRESLFRPFQSTKKQGLGIGLFQSRAIVQAHGGVMHVESEVGKGTTFVASFPVNHQA